MRSGNATHRRGTSLVRSLLVSVATLTILLVCFSIYQYAQDEPPPVRKRLMRLPETPSRPLTLRDEGIDPNAPAVDSASGPRIGAGEKIKITVYGRDSDRARFEITVDDLIPVTGSINEFLLTAPEIRMRTQDGHAVRVTAQRGVLEAERKRGGALDPQRGKLVGAVTIEYDLLSERQRAELPPDQRERIDPSDLMLITMDKVEFDLEYSKLIVPGTLHVLTSDMEFHATDIEIRFNDAENRVEYLRVSRGGKLKLRNRGARFGLGLPGGDSRGKSELTLMEWMRSWLEAKARAQEAQTRQADATPSTEPVLQTKNGIPVFHTDGRKPQPPRAPVRYRSRFEGDVDARQVSGGVMRAHLLADVLEVLHDLSEDARPETASIVDDGSAATSAAETNLDDQFELTWSGRLVVSACAADDDLCFGEGIRPVMASGMPMRLVSAGNDVECRRMTYDPDTSEVSAYGTKSDPAIARFDGQGVVSGVAIHSKRQGDDISVSVVGPGRLVRGRIDPPSNTGDGNQPRSAVAEFLGRLEVQGRIFTRPRFDRVGLISLSRSRVIQRAVFDGRVTVTQDDTTVAADDMTIGFSSPRGWFAAGQYVNKVVGHGNVEMTQQEDSVSCQEIDVSLKTDTQGNPVPVVAIARGDVLVARGDGTIIRAKEQLIVDFETGSGEQGKIQATGAKAVETRDLSPVVAQGVVDTPTRTTRIRRLRGVGDVSIQDPARNFELSAGSFDCTLTAGREIDTAVVEGQGDRPAVVRLDTFTVSGNRITIDVPGQSADVPGAGRLTFRSMRDLDGRRSKEPIPIVVTWTRRMSYRGMDNRALFEGDVHAASAATTFDCDELLVEFADVAAPIATDSNRSALGIIKNMVHRLVPFVRDSGKDSLNRRVSKEPVYLLATGNAVALTSELDPTTGAIKSRARLAGPKLSVNLRPEVSKMVIEGPGNLLLEDNRPFDPTNTDTPKTREAQGLFAVGGNDGPSNTLIEWKELMWYDFGVNQTRFEGDVHLKHFSGAELLKMRPGLLAGAAEVPLGRATYLRCDALTVDFLTKKDGAASPRERRMSALSADRLQQFQATGSVSLQDESEGLSLSADRVVYWKDREVLGIYGHPRRKAHVAIQRPGELPHQLSVERLFYNLATGTWELSKPQLTAR